MTKGVSLTGVAANDAQKIQTYLQGVDKNAKLRSKVDENGNRIIYASTKPSGFFEQLTGSAKQKKAAAHRVLDGVIGQLRDKGMAKTYNAASRTNRNQDFKDASIILKRSPGESPRAANAKAAVMIASGSADRLDFEARNRESLSPSKFGDLSAAYNKAAAELQAGKKDDAIQTLSDAIVTGAKQNLTDTEKTDFVFSPGMALRREIDTALAGALGAAYDQLLPHGESGTERRDFLADVVVRASAQVLDDKQVDATTIKIGGKEYKLDTSVGPNKDGLVGKGGFASVYIYKHTAPNGTTEQIAVKLSQPFRGDDLDSKFVDMGKEVQMHKAAISGGGDNIVGLKGAFRTPDGRIGIAMELCPKGNVEKAVAKLDQAVKAGTISPSAAAAVRLTLLQDAAKGVAQMEKNGLLHGDLKPQNVLISADGVAKVADLGTAQNSKDFVLADSSDIGNPSWLAPEFLKGKVARIDAEKGRAAGLKGAAKKAETALKRTLRNAKNLTQGQRGIVLAMISGDAERAASKVSVGNKIDSWGLGAIGLNLYAGRLSLGDPPPLNGWQYIVEKATLDFSSNTANRAIAPKGTPGSFAESRGLGAEEDLINQLLHPDKDQRPTAAQVLNHAAFKGPGIGSPEARDLIKALMTDPEDTDAMKRASTALSAPPRPSAPLQTG